MRIFKPVLVSEFMTKWFRPRHEPSSFWNFSFCMMADSCLDITLSMAEIALLMVIVRFLSHLTVPDMASLVRAFNNASVSSRDVCLVAAIACSRKLTSSCASAACVSDCCSVLAIIHHLLFLHLIPVHPVKRRVHLCCSILLQAGSPDLQNGLPWLTGRAIYCEFP